MNKDGLEGRAKEVHGEEGKRVFHQDLLISLGMGAESEERPQQIVCYRAGRETRELDLGERRESEDLQPACFPALLPPQCDWHILNMKSVFSYKIAHVRDMFGLPLKCS